MIIIQISHIEGKRKVTEEFEGRATSRQERKCVVALRIVEGGNSHSETLRIRVSYG